MVSCKYIQYIVSHIATYIDITAALNYHTNQKKARFGFDVLNLPESNAITMM